MYLQKLVGVCVQKWAFQQSDCDWLVVFRLGLGLVRLGVCVCRHASYTSASLSCSYFCLKFNSPTVSCHAHHQPDHQPEVVLSHSSFTSYPDITASTQ